MAFEDKYKYNYKDCPYTNPMGVRKRNVKKIRQNHQRIHKDKALKNIQQIYTRIYYGWSIEDTIKVPCLGHGGDRYTKKYSIR